MKYYIDGEEYDVIIEKKRNKNTYIRVKDDMKIYVSTSIFTSKGSILRLLDENKSSLIKMLNSAKKRKNKEEFFFYLGNRYDIIIVPSQDNVEICDGYIYTKSMVDFNKWFKNEILRVFDERFIYNFNRFNENVKSPILKIRTMKTRWGVYNRANHSITLNSKLIEYDYEKIDYVIIHELSHIIHFDHSASFWALVSKYCPNYKEIRKEMKD